MIFIGIIINACNDTHVQNKRKSLFKHEYLKHNLAEKSLLCKLNKHSLM